MLDAGFRERIRTIMEILQNSIPYARRPAPLSFDHQCLHHLHVKITISLSCCCRRYLTGMSFDS